MRRIEKFELMYIRFLWVFASAGIVFVVLPYLSINVNIFNLSHQEAVIHICLFSLLIVINCIKILMFKRGLFYKDFVYFSYRAVEIFILLTGSVYLKSNLWAYMIYLFLIMVTCLVRGSKIGRIGILYSIFVHLMISASTLLFSTIPSGLSNFLLSYQFIMHAFFYLITLMFVELGGKVYDYNFKNERENKRLLKELNEKYEQLAVAQDESVHQFQKLKDINLKLEETNKKLTISIAEFYTLQQISQAISSIFNTKELIKYVNDIILGVMGVNYSTIIQYDEKTDKLKIFTTNISDKNNLDALNNNVDSSVLKEVLNNGKPLIENFVNSDIYKFTADRDVNSLICVPLNSKTRKYGMVLVEHKLYNAFDDENVRLLDIIGQQVGIALENAYLYQRMQEMATVDGLTGVYNRIYFQERLQLEFLNAQTNDYNLSLVILDADHFKKFNDNFGHVFGDKVLKTMAQLIGQSLKKTDVLARYGGEEFIILMPKTTLSEAYERVEQLRLLVAGHKITDKTVTVNVTASFGVANYPETSNSETGLIKDADNALYAAKSNGRNCVMVAEINI